MSVFIGFLPKDLAVLEAHTDQSRRLGTNEETVSHNCRRTVAPTRHRGLPHDVFVRRPLGGRRSIEIPAAAVRSPTYHRPAVGLPSTKTTPNHDKENSFYQPGPWLLKVEEFPECWKFSCR